MKKIYHYLIALLVCSVGTSCGDDYFDINTDPNAAQSSTIELTLPSGIAGTAYVLGGRWQILGSIWGQHWTQSPDAQQYRDWDRYFIDANDFDRQWSTFYSGADRGSANLDGAGILKDLEFVRSEAVEVEDWTHFLIATTMRAYATQMLTDMYGDIPFTEALQGTANLAPTFDASPDIYDSLLVELDTALSKDLTIDTSTPTGPRTVGNEDLVFNGEMENWVRFANTVKLKLYLRQTNVTERQAAVESGVSELINSGAEFLTNTSALVQVFADADDQRNPFYSTEVFRFGDVNLVASNTSLNFLLENGDPRIEALYTPAANSDTFVGLPQGNLNDGGQENDDLSRVVSSPIAPVYFITQAETYFLLAEVAVRYGLGLDAQALYEEGIRASFDRLGVTFNESLIADGGNYAFPSAAEGSLTLEETQIKAIITQKWIELNGIGGPEAFYEFNRTGYPSEFTVSANSTLSPGQFPQRLPNDIDEANRNPNSPRSNRNQVSQGVWWSQQAN
ncbi:SusD/RagB family nutrient-binding outer membrane lipoprotein [Limibacter armeniacum]|uniref:SusD/RagB family nutrient-binding outer membrane lipoprotein n=1 Tax=Limibacter armeniacum TaxID=466084 RepID=UPI002FE6061F